MADCVTWCCRMRSNKQSSGTLFVNWPSARNTSVEWENLWRRRPSERHLWVTVPFKPSLSALHQPKGDKLLISMNVVVYLFLLRLNWQTTLDKWLHYMFCCNLNRIILNTSTHLLSLGERRGTTVKACPQTVGGMLAYLERRREERQTPHRKAPRTCWLWCDSAHHCMHE